MYLSDIFARNGDPLLFLEHRQKPPRQIARRLASRPNPRALARTPDTSPGCAIPPGHSSPPLTAATWRP